ncbi:hypothetical protein [Hymenobacter metallicola]|uniref:Macroglobulin domain-containing protein n=1 Tax=Hymenobacter metallicola TaxID=2563114 RepID=A0A4Z0QL74_9BACT|nr:hypothetical protein [Hymenobacter metallicola]TGE29482.1 hypothetical protein E5K02_08520 [Hymenobacter metallicola]
MQHFLTYGRQHGYSWALALLLWGLLGQPAAVAQQTDSLSSINRQLSQYRQQALQEKLYLHLDRSLYVSGELLWFKIYALDGATNRPLPLSKIAYVEVLDAQQKPVLQTKVSLRNATGQGSLALPSSVASGNYTVRAYTSWMKNFSPDFYFTSPVTILNTFTTAGLRTSKDSARYDVQFFPEGGNLVKGLSSTVAFKITDSAGRSLEAQGVVLDPQNKVVARFKTLRFGMGRFTLLPQQIGAAYTAVVSLPGKPTLSRRLPAVFEQGYVMQLQETAADQLQLTVQSTAAAGGSGTTIYLLGHARQQVAVSARAVVQDGKAVFIVRKPELAAGITHFTIFNERKQPLCERLYFKRPTEQLRLQVATDKPAYGTREKVGLRLATEAAAGSANLSLAVYRLDSLAGPTAPASLLSYAWLTSDLRGTVENPDYYFTAPDTSRDVRQATDNLMLTHGWTRFRWTEVLTNQPRQFEFLPELNGHLVRGVVTNRLTRAPAKDVAAYLASPSRRIQLYNSVSKADGTIQFETKDLLGLKEIVVQTNAQQDSSHRIEIFDPFSLKYAESRPVPVGLPARLAEAVRQRHVGVQAQNTFFRKNLATYAPVATDSVPFYGAPSEKFRLDDYTRFRVMEEVMREYVPGVQVRLRKGKFYFQVHDDPHGVIFDEDPLVLLDGVPVFNTNKIMQMDPLRIQKLEVVRSRYLQGNLLYHGVVSYTTYKGDLAGFVLDPHALVQEYEGVQQQREFYAPQYETAQDKQSRLPDYRSLLYWNPQLALGGKEALEKQLSFFTSDQVGRYLIMVQGLSATGLAGSSSLVVEVKPAL